MFTQHIYLLKYEITVHKTSNTHKLLSINTALTDLVSHNVQEAKRVSKIF